MRSLALTPTWSVATVLTVFVFVSIAVERGIHRLSNWLKRTRRNPLFEAVEKMKEELMLLGFISLLLVASSRIISGICVDSRFYSYKLAPCNPKESDSMSEEENGQSNWRGTCKEGYEPFLSYEGLEQLHRFIFVMAITHVFYSCLTILLAIVKVHSWRKWEEEARRDRFDGLAEVSRALTMRRQSTFVKYHTSSALSRNRFLIWVTCFFRQFGISVVRADYLSLRTGFITNHNLMPKYDFHSYMIRSMEEEFKMIVGVSAPLWAFVVAFMLFNINGSNLYFWIAILPIALVLLMGTKLQHVIATLALETVSMDGYGNEVKMKPRDELFWFNKPEILLRLIHFVLFQNSFELASFFWFWWQFGYDSCFISKHWLVYARLLLGFAAQFLCSYSTLPLYALVTQMGTRYKAALIPRRIRDSIHGWRKDAKHRRNKMKRHGYMDDSTTIRTETSTVYSFDADDQLLEDPITGNHIEIQIDMPTDVDAATTTTTTTTTASPIDNEGLRNEISNMSSMDPLIRPVSVPVSPSMTPSRRDAVSRSFPVSPSMSDSGENAVIRSFSMPAWRG